MSGGHFDYTQHLIADAAEKLAEAIAFPSSEIAGNEAIAKELLVTERVLREAAIRLQRADWLLSGDDGPEEYLERLTEELEENARRRPPQWNSGHV